MGCSNSTSLSKSQGYIERKPTVWLIGGGPGSNKGKIIEYLIRDYKFKYLSSFEILQFQKERNGPEAEQIKKCILEKKDFSSELVVKLIKKAISYMGPRRYLIDGFPRSKADIVQFEKRLSSRQILLEKFIQLQVSDQKMKQTGTEAKKDDKKTKQQIQTQVQQVIKQYRLNSSQILSHYRQRNKVISIDCNISEDEAYNQLRNQFQEDTKFRKIQQGDVKVFFTSFDSQQHQLKFCDDLVRKYGLYYYDCKELVREAKQKNPNQSKFIEECEKKKQNLPSQFLIDLMRKKIERKDFFGSFLVSGFPRNINDSEQWDRSFGWETQISGYLSFQIQSQAFKTQFQKQQKNLFPNIKIEQLIKNLQSHLMNKKVIYDHYQKDNKLLKVNAQNEAQLFEKINKFFQSAGINLRSCTQARNILFVSTICNDAKEFSKLTQNQSKNAKQINMMYCYEHEIKENNLYSELINTFVSAGNPVPGDIAVRVLLKYLNQIEPMSNNIIVKGFPNSSEQLLVWEEQVGENFLLPKVVYFAATKLSIKGYLSQKNLPCGDNQINSIIRNSEHLQTNIKAIDWKSLRVDEKTSKQQISKFFQ